MTQEEKDLLLRDLCARLPYHCRVFYEYVDDLDNKTYGYSITLNTWCIDEINADKAVVKPYLRPMSSMTEEEREELEHLSEEYFGKALDKQIQESLSSSNRNESEILEYIASSVIVDWLNKYHFDYRGLVPKNLAIEVTEENNPYEN